VPITATNLAFRVHDKSPFSTGARDKTHSSQQLFTSWLRPDILHQPLESRRGIVEAKRHHIKFIQT
jgi:hypothetical protein